MVSAGPVVSVAVVVVTLGITALATTTTESFLCTRLDICLFSKTRVGAVLRTDGPVQEVTLSQLPDGPRLRRVDAGFIVALAQDRALALVDPPLAADQRLSPRPLRGNEFRDFSARLAGLEPRLLAGLLDGPLRFLADEAEIAALLRNALLGAGTRLATCEAVAASAWRLAALATLGAGEAPRDRTRLSLRAVALGCPDATLPTEFQSANRPG